MNFYTQRPGGRDGRPLPVWDGVRERPPGRIFRPLGNPQPDLGKAERQVDQLLQRLANADKKRLAGFLRDAVRAIGRRDKSSAQLALAEFSRQAGAGYGGNPRGRKAPFNRRYLVNLVADLQAAARRL